MTERDPRHDVLFETVPIGPKTIPNRFFAVPHSAGMGVEKPGSQAALRGMKAEGGWGAVCLEFAPVSYDSDTSPSLSAHLWDSEDARRLSLACASIHAHGSLAGIELTHLGGAAPRTYTRWPAIAPSAVAISDPSEIPKAMDRSDIERVQNDWTNAAIRALDIGFDIVYVYATDLISQFLSPVLNQRTDAYGGSLSDRMRFYLETLERVRGAVGNHCAVATRIGIDGLREKSVPDDDILSILQAVDPFVDLWDINREPADPAVELAPSRAYRQGSQRDLGLWARQATTKPIVGVGRLTDPDLMVELLKAGAMDLVGGARPSIADPFLPTKIREGRYNDIRECIGCNVCARTAEFGAPHLNCTQNATAGEEHRRGWHPEFIPATATPNRSVLVVGGGPAGMECAIVLGKRGFEHVHLVEAGSDLGGHMRWVPNLPNMGTWNRVVEWRISQLRALTNVETIVNKRLSAAEVFDYGADTVIIATGAHWSAKTYQAALVDAADRVLLPDEIMMHGRRPAGPRVVVYDADGYFVAAGIAELLASEGYRVRLAAPQPQIAAGAYATAEAAILRRALHTQGVAMHPGLSLVEFDGDVVRLQPEFGQILELPADCLVLVTQRESNDGLYVALTRNPEELAASGVSSVLRVGDCVAPRLLADAIFDGHRVGREVDGPHPEVPLPMRSEHDWHDAARGET